MCVSPTVADEHGQVSDGSCCFVSKNLDLHPLVDLTDTISEPDQNKVPGCWSICYSTSRGCEAADRFGNSLLVLGQLDLQSDIFGVSLKQDIEWPVNFCEPVER